ncbi:MAG: AAA family ATPase [Actinomycetota bacterium]|nr:AAA family ATPase [Actinomycetota bacterium]
MSERLASPFRPGFALEPAVLAGRDGVLEEAQEAITVAALDRRAPTPLVVVGARGVGKTVLLAEIAARAGTEHGFARLHVEVRSPGMLVEELSLRARELARLIAQAPRERRMRASEMVLRGNLPGIGAEVRLAREPEAQLEPRLRMVGELGALAAELRERDTGIVLSVDEAQLAERAELHQLGAVLQQAMAEEWPVVTVIAGLASLREPDRLPTYFERAEWFELGSLDEASTVRALAEPAAAVGRPFDRAALDYLAQQTGGYPYAIQLYGHHAWRASKGQRQITLAAAEQGSQSAGIQLERGLYARRWTQAPPREREYLVALAEVQSTTAGPVTGGDVARSLGRPTSAVAVYRGRLIDRGTLVGEGERLSFAVPGMADYVLKLKRSEQPAPRRARGTPRGAGGEFSR